MLEKMRASSAVALGSARASRANASPARTFGALAETIFPVATFAEGRLRQHARSRALPGM
jgi:hypothetical protein